MKFVEDYLVRNLIMITDTGVEYRTNLDGNNWERLYGQSWEPVYLKEEEECIKAFNNYFSGVAQW